MSLYDARNMVLKALLAYQLEPDELRLWMLMIACPPDAPPGPSAVTMNAIEPGQEVALIDVFQGTPYHTSLARWDYVIKEFWVSFSQPSRFRMFQPGFAGGETACLCYTKAFEQPANLFTVGWTRSLLEDITLQSRLYIYVRNEGTEPMYGKVWVTGYEKPRAYEWL